MEAKQIYQWLEQQCAKAAEEWFCQQRQSLFAQLCLYYRRGELTVAEKCPPGFTLGSGTRLAPGETKDQIQRQIHYIAGRLPCLPEAELH